MRAVNLGQAVGGDQQSFNQWVQQAFREIETASYEEIAEVADAFTISGTFTETRTLNVSAPTTANIVAVLATFINDFKKRSTHTQA